MGYEVRLHIGEKKKCCSGEDFMEVLSMDMGKMGYAWYAEEFYDIFETPVTFKVYESAYWAGEGLPTYATERDNYGERLKYCTVDDVVIWYERYGKFIGYDLVDILYSMMIGIKKAGHGDWIVIKYGY